jgi:hypothetical protein
MDAKVTPIDRFEETKARHFREMTESPAFRVLWLRINAELERMRLGCERNESDLEVRRCQGAVRALRTVLGLPEAILAEMKKSKKV